MHKTYMETLRVTFVPVHSRNIHKDITPRVPKVSAAYGPGKALAARHPAGRSVSGRLAVLLFHVTVSD